MAEMLIVKQDKFLVHSHQELPGEFAKKEARGWRRGDIVVVRADGHPWTDREKVTFTLVKLPGVPVARLSEFCGPQFEENPDVGNRAVRPYRHKNRSLYRWDDTSGEIVNKVSSRGFSDSQIRDVGNKDDFENFRAERGLS